jgi:hypothetical protein
MVPDDDSARFVSMRVIETCDYACARRGARVRFVSPGIVPVPKDKAGFSKGALVSDPDGHNLLLIQK